MNGRGEKNRARKQTVDETWGIEMAIAPAVVSGGMLRRNVGRMIAESAASALLERQKSTQRLQSKYLVLVPASLHYLPSMLGAANAHDAKPELVIRIL